MSGKPFIVIGAGGHAKVVVDLLLGLGEEVAGLTDADPTARGRTVLDVPVLGGDEVLDGFTPDSVRLALGVGASGGDLCGALKVRQNIADKLQRRGYAFPPLVHTNAVVGRGCVIDDGAQIMAGAVVQAGCRIEAFAIVNTRATVDHDCKVGVGAHIAPGAALGGTVSVGEAAYVAIGASVLHGVTIGEKALVGAGAAVIDNVQDGTRVMGVPARSRL